MANREYDVVKFLTERKNARINNNFFLLGDQISTYATVIAKVDRDNKTVILDVNKYTNTTAKHQNAIRKGVELLKDEGWRLLESLERF